MQNIVYKLLSHMDYKTYNMLSSLALPYTMGSTFAGVMNENIGFIIIGLLGFWFDFHFYNKDAIFQVKDIKEIEELFQVFLDNYHKLNAMFDLKNPMDIMLLYTYLLKNGYLSENGNYKYCKPSSDKRWLLSYQVFTGESVCRHDASLLQNILRCEGIKSCVLTGYLTFSDLDFEKASDTRFKIMLDILKTVYENEPSMVRKNFFDLIDDGLESGFLTYDMFHIPDYKTNSNHGIAIASYEGKSYYMDATNELLYRKCNIDRHLVLQSGLSTLIPYVNRNGLLYYFLTNESLREVKQILEGVNISLSEEKNAREKINGIVDENMDILEKFYSENHELYCDIANNLSRLRTKIK